MEKELESVRDHSALDGEGKNIQSPLASTQDVWMSQDLYILSDPPMHFASPLYNLSSLTQCKCCVIAMIAHRSQDHKGEELHMLSTGTFFPKISSVCSS